LVFLFLDKPLELAQKWFGKKTKNSRREADVAFL
jgi:hypothetical protein